MKHGDRLRIAALFLATAVIGFAFFEYIRREFTIFFVAIGFAIVFLALPTFVLRFASSAARIFGIAAILSYFASLVLLFVGTR